MPRQLIQGVVYDRLAEHKPFKNEQDEEFWTNFYTVINPTSRWVKRSKKIPFDDDDDVISVEMNHQNTIQQSDSSQDYSTDNEPESVDEFNILDLLDENADSLEIINAIENFEYQNSEDN